MIRERRYVVVKRSDALGALTSAEVNIFNILIDKVDTYRKAKRNKPELQCVVVEHDWPEYETVWKMIEARVENEKWS